jgi:putative DNA primase/helicase
VEGHLNHAAPEATGAAGATGENGTVSKPHTSTNAPKMQSPDDSNTLARAAIRAILDGQAPNGTAPGNCGAWADVIAAVIEAHQVGGTPAARRAFDALARQDPALARLVAGDPVPVQTATPEYLTDLGNARRLVRLHGHDLRYVRAWGWLRWDGRRWERDETGEVVRRAKAVALGYYDDAQTEQDRAKAAMQDAQRAADAGDLAAGEAADRRLKQAQRMATTLAGWGKASQARGRLESMVVLAQTEAAIAERQEVFDAQPWALNLANCTLDLRSGAIRAHDRADLLTTAAPVAYDPTATCPRWLAFLARIMDGNQDLISFLQRIVGYALTGDVSEQCLFLLHGSGSNGKSTFLKTILAMLGKDYSTQAAPDVLIAGMNRHPTELADLAGKRLVASIEVEEGKRLAEALVKQLTGGDPLKARLMRQDFFQFEPSFKLFLAANHKPVIRGTDYAIWRRVKLIPFTVTIAEAEKDPHLLEKLLEELPGILAWAVAGCQAWQRDGLHVPAAVAAATEAYRAESDTIAAFLAEFTETGANLRVKAGDLYKAYKTWADAGGERFDNQTIFGRKIAERGFDKATDRQKGTWYLGVGLIEPDKAEP